MSKGTKNRRYSLRIVKLSSVQRRNWNQVRYYVRSVSASLGCGCSYKPRRKFKEIERSEKRERERTSFENFHMFHIGCYIVLRPYLTTFLGVIPNLQMRKLSFKETKEFAQGYISNNNKNYNEDLLCAV